MTQKTLCNQITIDIDPPNIEKKKNHAVKILKTYPIKDPFRYGHHYGGEIQVVRSPSGKGYHIIAWNRYGVPPKNLKELRRLCGDDKMRIYLDDQGHRQKQVLFGIKRSIKL